MSHENGTHRTLLTVSVITLILVIAQFFGMKYYVNQAIEANEAMKVGGTENYETLKTLYSSDWFKSAQKSQIESAVAQGAGGAQTPDANAGAQEEFPSGSLTDDQLDDVKDGAYVQGETNAKITIVEYTDPECPYCIRHYNDKTIENVMAEFDGEVNHIIKPVQGVNHTNTEYKSLAILCAGDLGGSDAYYGMYDKIVGGSTPSTLVANDRITVFAQELKLNASNFAECLNQKELASQYAANWTEALGFKSGGTPGNLIINNETGEYRLVSGAYPASNFSQIIAEMLN